MQPALMGSRLDLNGITFCYDTVQVLSDISMTVKQGQMVGVLGPNGSGKSTLIRMMTGFHAAQSGSVTLNSLALHQYTRDELACLMAVVLQESDPRFDFTVREVVSMGRFPHLGRLEREGPRDHERVDRALQLTGLTHLAERLVSQMSGGERQRVAIARALCQDPSIILLDEPTSNLDIHHQVEILDLLQKLNEDEHVTVLLVMHDLNLAALYCDRLILLSEGRIVSTGTPEEVITQETIQTVYGAEVMVTRHPIRDVPCVHLVPRRQRHYLADEKETAGSLCE